MRDEDGVWLLDASIIGLYNDGLKPDNTEYTKIIECSFENYCAPIIDNIRPAPIVVVGKTVYDRLSSIIREFNLKAQWINQPNARLKNQDKRTFRNI
jgi:hypothetical protein